MQCNLAIANLSYTILLTYCWTMWKNESSLFPGQGGHAYLKEWLWWAGLLSSEWQMKQLIFILKTNSKQLFTYNIHYIAKSIGAPLLMKGLTTLVTSLMVKHIMIFKFYSNSLDRTLFYWWIDEFVAQGLHLKSHQRCSAGIRIWLSADQSSSES